MRTQQGFDGSTDAVILAHSVRQVPSPRCDSRICRLPPAFITPETRHAPEVRLVYAHRIPPQCVAVHVHDREVQEEVDAAHLAGTTEHFPVEIEAIRINQTQRPPTILILRARQDLAQRHLVAVARRDKDLGAGGPISQRLPGKRSQQLCASVVQVSASATVVHKGDRASAVTILPSSGPLDKPVDTQTRGDASKCRAPRRAQRPDESRGSAGATGWAMESCAATACSWRPSSSLQKLV